MASAGAPAPPPPPPPPGKNFSDLPTEMLLNIIQYLKPGEYVSFALAAWPILENHGLVPPLTEDLYRQIMNERFVNGRIPPPVDFGAPKALFDHTMQLPREITDEIISYLQPADLITFLFTHRRQFWDYLPRLSQQTKRFVRRSKKG